MRTPAVRLARPKVRTPMGWVGRGGGRWRTVPHAIEWYSSTVQVNGIYPYAVGTARPTSGAPLGYDLRTQTAVAFDHDSLYQDGVISSPSMFLYGINGVGKSSTAQTIVLCQMGRGMIPIVHNPFKADEHTPLIEEAGGDVFAFGPRAKSRINLLSLGPLGKAAAEIGGAKGAELRELAIWKTIQASQLVLRTNRDRPLTDFEELLIEALVGQIHRNNPRPATRDLLQAYESPSADVLARMGSATVQEFHSRFAGLGDSIRSLLGGDLGRLLGAEDSIEIQPGKRGGVCFDTSSIPQSATKLLSTAMLMSWSLGADAMDAHWELAENERALANAAAIEGEQYSPRYVWTGYTTLMDEFWYPMRSVEGIVDRADALSRANRAVGTAELKITHTPKDMLSLPNEKDRQAAKGLTERSGVLALMAMTREDLEVLATVKSLTEEEINEAARFNAALSWGESRGLRSTQTPPPGAGKVLMKVEGRPGIPIQMVKTTAQSGLHRADMRVREQRRVSGERMEVS